MDTGGASLLDFTFNGWGEKFEARLDNQITRRAVKAGALKGQYKDYLNFVLKVVPSKVTEPVLCSLLPNVYCLHIVIRR